MNFNIKIIKKSYHRCSTFRTTYTESILESISKVNLKLHMNIYINMNEIVNLVYLKNINGRIKTNQTYKFCFIFKLRIN